MSQGIYASSGHHANPMSVMAVVVGMLGAVASVTLWLARYNPDGPVVRWVTTTLEGVTPEQLALLAATLGTMAILAAILVSFGGFGGFAPSLAIALGVVALSYPVLSYLNVMSGGLRPNLFS
jgi:hypothetical protein